MPYPTQEIVTMTGIQTYILRGVKQALKTYASPVFNVDNGAGTTNDQVIARPADDITIKAARVVYTTETAGTIAAANVKLGITVAGAEIVAATALENTKAVGATTALALTSADYQVPAGTPIIARHTGVAAVAAGEYFVEIDYIVNS